MAQDLGLAYGHCEVLLRQADKDRWLAALFAPAGLRPSLHAVAAFTIEVGRVRSRVKQPLAGELRLQWWRDVLEGEARGDVSSNPVAAALLDTIERHGLSRGTLLDVVEAHRVALYAEALADTAAMEGMFHAIVGGPMRVSTQVLGNQAVGDGGAVRHAAIALGIVDLIRDLPLRASDGFAEVPDEILARHGAGRSDLRGGSVAEAIPAAIADLRGLARGHLTALRARRAEIDERVAPVFLPVNLVEPMLRLSETPGADPFGGLRPLPQWRRQWILWRAARRGGLL